MGRPEVTRRRSRELRGARCKPPRAFEGDPPIESCGTAKGVTLCEGDRVARLAVGGRKFPHHGTVLGVQLGQDNRGRKELAARVCWDNAEAGDAAYRYLFSELRKVK